MLELKSAHKRLTTRNLPLAEESIQTVQQILHRIEAEIKRIVYDLRPPTLDALGLAPALRRYTERFERYTGLPCSLQILGEPARLTPKVEICIYRLMQEALQNISAHADATQSSLMAVFAPQIFKLTIIDDGCGFDLQAVLQHDTEHLGLLSMMERAERLGGRLTIHTQPGHGTCVELLVPIKREMLLE